MLKVGMTGGIGCGKSTVSNLFKELDVPVIDADDIAHQLVEPGQPALVEVCKAFGEPSINPDGSLNRNYLREIIYTDPLKKKKLEEILHPLVFTAIQATIEQLNKPYCIISIPLLFETHRADFVDRILVIDCPTESQIERVKLRDNLTNERIQSIIDSQASRNFRLTHADDVIDNSGSNSELAEQVKKLHNLYMTISAATGKPSP